MEAVVLELNCIEKFLYDRTNEVQLQLHGGGGGGEEYRIDQKCNQKRILQNNVKSLTEAVRSYEPEIVSEIPPGERV